LRGDEIAMEHHFAAARALPPQIIDVAERINPYPWTDKIGDQFMKRTLSRCQPPGFRFLFSGLKHGLDGRLAKLRQKLTGIID
jgi:hypothetical protein